MKKERIVNIIFIAIFAICITLPTLMVNRDDSAVSLLENKKLATFPTWEDKDVKTFVSEFETWFNDNVGLKENAVILNICAKWTLFRDLDLPNYFIGEEGHLFYSPGNQMIDTFQRKDSMTKEQTIEMAEYITFMRNFYEKKGSKFYFIPIPDKEQIYPEYYPKSIKRYEDNTKLDDLISYLDENTDVRVCNTKVALLNSKSNESNLLYYKNYDPTHWNGRGAMVGYDAIMKLIKKDFGDINIYNSAYWKENINNSKGTVDRLESIDAICKTHKFSDQILTFDKKNNIEVDNDILQTVDSSSIGSYVHYNNKNVNEGYTIMIIGDSYINSFLLPQFAESFKDVYFVQSIDKGGEILIHDIVKPDIVLFEFVERMENFYSLQNMVKSYKN